MRKRLDTNDLENADLLKRVDQLEQWRVDMEDRLAAKNKWLDTKFETNDERFLRLTQRCDVEFKEAERQYGINDKRDDKYQGVFDDFDNQIDEILD